MIVGITPGFEQMSTAIAAARKGFEAGDDIKEIQYKCKEYFLIPYPVFVKQQNYTGYTPKLIKSSFLMKYIYENFIAEYRSLGNPK